MTRELKLMAEMIMPYALGWLLACSFMYWYPVYWLYAKLKEVIGDARTP